MSWTAPPNLLGRRIGGYLVRRGCIADSVGTIAQIDDSTFTVKWENGTTVTYPIRRLIVDNMMGNLRVD